MNPTQSRAKGRPNLRRCWPRLRILISPLCPAPSHQDRRARYWTAPIIAVLGPGATDDGRRLREQKENRSRRRPAVSILTSQHSVPMCAMKARPSDLNPGLVQPTLAISPPPSTLVPVGECEGCTPCYRRLPFPAPTSLAEIATSLQPIFASALSRRNRIGPVEGLANPVLGTNFGSQEPVWAPGRAEGENPPIPGLAEGVPGRLRPPGTARSELHRCDLPAEPAGRAGRPNRGAILGTWFGGDYALRWCPAPARAPGPRAGTSPERGAGGQSRAMHPAGAIPGTRPGPWAWRGSSPESGHSRRRPAWRR